jgi:lysozyme
VSEQRPLAPKGFKPKPVRPGNYVDRHPTRYIWRKDIQKLIRRVYEKFGWAAIHITTYVDHPASEFYEAFGGRDTASFDVWGPAGRGDPLPKELGDKVFDFIYSDPKPPWIDWIIWQARIRTREEGFVARPFGEDEFSFHNDHIHITFTGSYRRLPKVPLAGPVKPNPKPQPKPEDRPSPPQDDVWGIDVASHQGRLDMAGVKKEGYSFVVQKASEGTYYPNRSTQAAYPALARDNVKRAEAAGLVTGWYHYLTNGPVDKQVDNFLRVAGKDLDGKLVMVDVEDLSYDGVDYAPQARHVQGFVNELRRRIGDHPILIYSADWFWKPRIGRSIKALFPNLVPGEDIVTWDAEYVEPRTGFASAVWDNPLIQGGSKWAERWGGVPHKILQFTDRALVQGQYMDADKFNGTLDELKALTRTHKPAPVTPPPEEEEELPQVDREQERKAARAARLEKRKAERAEKRALQREEREAERVEKKDRPTKVGSKRGGAIGAGLYLLVDALQPYIEQIPPDAAAQLAPLIIGLAYFLPRVLEARALDE